MVETNERLVLEALYEDALAYVQRGRVSSDIQLEDRYNAYCQIIIGRQERNKGVLAVLITLLLKKICIPEQDIRMHQSQLPGGFSGRTLDTQITTPFLRDKGFPHMSESGWLTRSLEQSHPYDFDYPGRITPSALKEAFLILLDGVQNRGLSARNLLIHIFVGLIRFKNRTSNYRLNRPHIRLTETELSIAKVVGQVSQHHGVQMQGASRLPVLAIQSILNIIAKETNRYKDCTVLPLEHHNAADLRTDLIGDVNIVDANNRLFEGYEIKHNIRITSGLIRTSFEKLRFTPVRRFYILTTYPHEDYSEFEPDIQQVAQEHGCQLIVNGIDRTLMYYLRLIGDTNQFVNEYVDHLESDPSISLQLKEAWNEITEE